MSLEHPRNYDLCSATSAAAVVKYLKQDQNIDAREVAQGALDSGFDIYGNWIFCTAQSATMLGSEWSSWVGRLSNFDEVIDRLQEGFPVVMSIRGPLEGSYLPYAKGHLLAVIGYDSASQSVLCMDPAFPQNVQDPISYKLEDFLKASKRRGYVAYFFDKVKV